MKIFYLNIILLSFFSCNIFNPGINYRSHSDFKNFWSDFRTAALNNDREAVLSMTKIPFGDGNYVYDPENNLNSETKKKFLLNYDRIFTPDVITSIRLNKIIGYEDSMEDEPSGPMMGVEDYILNVESSYTGKIHDLYFSKVNGIYKLTGIPYYP
jgi:hypothetical protein